MAEQTNNARIFREMQSADAIRQEMRQGIVERFRQSDFGQALGNVYDSDVAKGAVGALHDAYRRVFEQGYWGKDVFDGRWHMDNQVGQDRGDFQGMKEQYDTRASFYGWDASQTHGQDQAREQGREQGRDDDQEMGR